MHRDRRQSDWFIRANSIAGSLDPENSKNTVTRIRVRGRFDRHPNGKVKGSLGTHVCIHHE